MPLWGEVEGPAGALAVHVAAGSLSASPALSPPGTLLISHGFPSVGETAAQVGRSLPALADHLSGASGWRVITGCLRGVGASTGDFSLEGWFEDLQALLDHAQSLAGTGGVWLAGFGTGGALGLCLAAADDRVRGVAALGAPATFERWAADLAGLADAARAAGMLRSSEAPEDLAAWGRGCTLLVPLEAARSIAPRPMLFVQGTEDDRVPVAEARELAAAAQDAADLRLLVGAGHHLRADPRAVALLLGWLERQA